MAPPRQLLIASLGVVPYAEALEMQRAAARARLDGSLADDLLILLEHPPVITFGRSTKQEHLLLSREALATRGVELFEVERGGDITFHGPGQLVGYPILDLHGHREDLHWYLRQVEELLIRALGAMEITAGRTEGKTGVWTGERKIASIGVHARQWVTWHGFALNVTTDLSWFDLMIPCGIAGVQMTSVDTELRMRADGMTETGSRERSEGGTETGSGDRLMAATRDAVVAAAADVFSVRPVEILAADLPAAVRAAAEGPR